MDKKNKSFRLQQVFKAGVANRHCGRPVELTFKINKRNKGIKQDYKTRLMEKI